MQKNDTALDTLLDGVNHYVAGDEAIFDDATAGYDEAAITPGTWTIVAGSSSPCGVSVGSVISSVVGTVKTGC
ncbi:hypothetical protein [Patulibacter americanus]|jgi:hypothetical protein|uniref:hypothetical protein n=1 Tax=Patulibacter americanus TaxID=588672 RepID=UPI0003B59C9D|nr:hypothetical protein [Patulibacter americanus]